MKRCWGMNETKPHNRLCHEGTIHSHGKQCRMSQKFLTMTNETSEDCVITKRLN